MRLSPPAGANYLPYIDSGSHDPHPFAWHSYVPANETTPSTSGENHASSSLAVGTLHVTSNEQGQDCSALINCSLLCSVEHASSTIIHPHGS